MAEMNVKAKAGALTRTTRSEAATPVIGVTTVGVLSVAALGAGIWFGAAGNLALAIPLIGLPSALTVESIARRWRDKS